MDQPALVGRAEQLAHLRAGLDQARSRTGTAVVLVGEAGIGKTSLLRRCAAEAPEFLVVGTRGTPSEMHLSYVGLYDVLGPLLPWLDEIPERHAAVVRSALALGAPVSAPPLELVVSVLGLLSAATTDRPLLVLVDDAQWVDDSTLSCLAVVARRLHAEGVFVVFSTRPLGPGEQTRITRLEGLPTLQVTGLDLEQSTELLSRTRPDVGGDRARAILREAGGNPLAIGVLGRFVPSGVTADLGLDARLDRVFAHELAQLERDARGAVEVMAVVGETHTSRLADALDRVGLLLRHLDAAERLGLVRLREGRATFAHPLIRAAVSSSLDGARLRDLHRVAAQVLHRAEGPVDAERRLWHLAEAAEGPDADLAAEMEALATTAVARSSPASAVRLLERAAALTPDPKARTGRLLRAADLLQVAGLVADSDRVLVAAAETADRVQSLVLEHRRARFQAWSGNPGLGRDTLMHLAESCRSRLPREAATMYGHAVLYSTALGELDRAAEAAAQADALTGAFDEPLVSVEAAAAMLDHLQNRPGPARARLARCSLETIDPLSTEQLVLIVAVCRFLDDDTAGGVRLLEDATVVARRSGATGLLPFQLSRLAVMLMASGQWPRALAVANESLELARLTGWVTEVPFALTWLARVEAAMGRAVDCRRHAALATASPMSVPAVVHAYADVALGLLALGEGDPEGALPHFAAAAGFARDHHVPDNPFLPCGSDLLECWARTGRVDEAARLARNLRRDAERSARPEPLIGILRGEALVEPDHEKALSLLTRSAELAARSGCDFEQARTLLCLGRLHRTDEGDRALSAAASLFRRLGASGWSAQTERELARTGSRRSAEHPLLSALTAQELNVAQLVATGQTNQEVADRLFLSIRTVEFHLSSVYRKLGVRRRTQLANVFPRGL